MIPTMKAPYYLLSQAHYLKLVNSRRADDMNEMTLRVGGIDGVTLGGALAKITSWVEIVELLLSAGDCVVAHT